jgi:PAS domain S-box-containing protein
MDAARRGAQDYLRLAEISSTVISKSLRYAIERKRHERELRRQKEFYENILMEANVWVEALDRTGNVILWNKGAEKITGYDARQMTEGRRWELLYPDALQRTDMRERYLALLQEGRRREYAGEIHTANGEKRNMAWIANPVRGRRSEIEGCVLIGHDMSFRPQAPLPVDAGEGHGEETEDTDSFTFGVAHDLKNPLSLILGYADLVQSDAEHMTGDELRKCMNSILFNGRKMISIINSLLLLASVRREPVHFEALNMQSIVTDALRRLRKSIEQAGITVKLPDRWYQASGHAPWIEEVWVNYIGNAVKYAGKGCHIGIEAVCLDDGRLRYSVTDDGPGIPADRLDELFVPFSRLSRVNTEGHGLGLSIVKLIIEKSGGRWECAPLSDRGAASISFCPQRRRTGRLHAPARTPAVPPQCSDRANAAGR